MRNLPAGISDRLNLADVVARIERQQAETRTFVAEQAKLTAEAATLNCDRFLAPAALLIATLGAITALGSIVARALAG